MINVVRLCYLLLLLIIPVEVVSQWNSFVVNYKKELFGRGAQTWQIKQYNKDHIYCGNKNGLLQYNGNQWILYPVINQMDVRIAHPSGLSKRIYVGGKSEFGYFEPLGNGEFLYHQTSILFNEKFPHRGGYWGIYEIDNILLYVSDKFIVKHFEERFTVIESDIKIDCSGIVNGVIYLGTTQGIKMLVGNSILSLPEGDILKNKTIRSIVPYDNGVMIATAFDSLYYLEEGRIEPYITGAEKFMKQNEIFSMAISGNNIAVGTIQKELVLIGENGELRYYNEQNGLQNNTILSICFDTHNNLWLGLDNGIDYISLNAPFTNLYTYPYSKGAGYAALIDDNKLFLGTNRGLYTCDWPVYFTEDQSELTFIPELSGQVWNLKKVGESIFCFHDKGLFIIHNHQIEQIDGLRGAILGMEHAWDPSLYWVGSYEGLNLLKKENSKWKLQQQIEDVEGWIWMKILFLNPRMSFG
ncbi:MAG: hypothetical protein LUD02_03245 [Tannerellaceae bacterium]|nr:hypothetical protein [Tannerellaceae bacterium]